MALASSQVITGTVAGDTLDNVDNTISGIDREAMTFASKSKK